MPTRCEAIVAYTLIHNSRRDQESEKNNNKYYGKND